MSGITASLKHIIEWKYVKIDDVISGSTVAYFIWSFNVPSSSYVFHVQTLCIHISDQCVHFSDSNTSTLKTMTVVYFLYCLDRFYEEEACFMSLLSSGLTEYTLGVVCNKKNTHSWYHAASTWVTTSSRKTWLFMKMGQQNWRRWWYMV